MVICDYSRRLLHREEELRFILATSLASFLFGFSWESCNHKKGCDAAQIVSQHSSTLIDMSKIRALHIGNFIFYECHLDSKGKAFQTPYLDHELREGHAFSFLVLLVV